LAAFKVEVEEYLRDLFSLHFCFAHFKGCFCKLPLYSAGSGMLVIYSSCSQAQWVFLLIFIFFVINQVLIIFSSFIDHPHNICETILKERILSASGNQVKQRKCRMRRVGMRAERDIRYFRYKLGEEVAEDAKICIHLFRKLFCIGKKYWKRLSMAALSKPPGPIQHGNVGNQNRHFGSVLVDTEPDVVAFLR
jgi:hypothetical protein